MDLYFIPAIIFIIGACVYYLGSNARNIRNHLISDPRFTDLDLKTQEKIINNTDGLKVMMIGNFLISSGAVLALVIYLITY